MKHALIMKHMVLEFELDWFKPCCFRIISLNFQFHNDKTWFDIGLFGVSFLVVVDYKGNILNEIKGIKDVMAKEKVS